jgi:hypothetical protein
MLVVLLRFVAPTGEDQKVLASINPKFLLLFFALKAH